jgi:cytochrome b pre-mRNA-processing protein 3
MLPAILHRRPRLSMLASVAGATQRKPQTVFRSARKPTAAVNLYEAIVQQAREPLFYAVLGVPDTVNGRFEMVALHAFLVLRRLKAAAEPAAALGQALFDTMFADMDLSLREMGAGDLGVGKRVKAMAEGFYGRIAAYDAALTSAAPDDLAEALRRNVYGTVKPPAAIPAEAIRMLAIYVRASAESLASQPDAELAAGTPRFAASGSVGPAH